uniref:Amine oxidase domain-containing protein n=1 Tax=Glycine max TaxID=3847 RepID=C6TC58_SOYBN|nr:unknown [Glycine max]
MTPSSPSSVKAGMLEGVESALGLSKGSLPKPFYTRLQLWGAVFPTNTHGVPCIFDPFGRAGICGDWLLGSNIEAAVLSGIALANHIADYSQSPGTDPGEFAVGLNHEFQPLEGHGIG